VLKTTDTVGVTKNRDHYTMKLNVPQVNFGSQVFPSTENVTTCILDIPEVVLHCWFCRLHYSGLYILDVYYSLRKKELDD
jgi:hypothetical protein